MVAVRIIPCLDVRDGRVVKGVRFRDHRDRGDIVGLAERYRDASADELVFYDITASPQKRSVDIEWVERVAAAIDIPFCVAGGIRDVATARDVLHAGADKIAFNTAAVQRPELLAEAAEAVGGQSVIVAIDARRRDPADPSLGFEVVIHGGRTPTGLDAIAWCVRAAELGAGEILLTSMDQDGTKAGFDLPLLREVTAAVSVPVIASGGAGSADHLAAAAQDGNASAVLAASIFHFGEVTVAEVKEAMAARGVPVRRVPPDLRL